MLKPYLGARGGTDMTWLLCYYFIWIQLVPCTVSLIHHPARQITPRCLPPTIINCLPKSLDVDLPPQAGTILSCLVLIDKAERTTTAHWTVEGVQVPTTVSHLPTTNGTSSMLNASTSVDAVLNMLRGREDICKLAISNSCGTSEHLLMVSFGRDLTSGLSFNGTGTPDALRDVVIIVSIGGGFTFFMTILVIVVLLFWCKRRKMRKKIHRLVEDMTNSYGSMSQSFAQSYHQNRHFSSLGRGKRQIFILYALELDTFRRVTREDYPTYSLVLDMANFLHTLNLPCLHDASEMFQCDSIQEFSSKVERAVKDSRAVIVICSEVLYTAFSSSSNSSKLVQMKFGKFSLSRVKKVMMKSSKKFVPVTLTGSVSVCKELQENRCFHIQNYEEFMLSVKKSSSTGEALSDPAFSEIRDLYFILQDMLGH